MLGSTLFNLTWKERATPSGRRICALRASARRTSGSGSGSSPQTGWATPDGSAGNTVDSTWEERRAAAAAKYGNNGFGLNLQQQATLTGWATPNARDEKVGSRTTYRERGGGAKGDSLSNQAASLLAGWPTTTVMDAVGARRHGYMNDGLERAAERPRRETLTGHSGTTLTDAALMTAPVPPTATGPTASGSTAETASTARLNPELPRWLMALPRVWDACAVTAMQSLQRSRSSGSKRAKRTG